MHAQTEIYRKRSKKKIKKKKMAKKNKPEKKNSLEIGFLYKITCMFSAIYRVFFHHPGKKQDKTDTAPINENQTKNIYFFLRHYSGIPTYIFRGTNTQ